MCFFRSCSLGENSVIRPHTMQRKQEYSLAGCLQERKQIWGEGTCLEAIKWCNQIFKSCSWREDFRSHTGKSFDLTNGKTKWGLGLPLLLLYEKLSQISWCKMCHYVHGFYVQEFRKGTVGPACSSSWGVKSKGRDSKAQSNSVAGAGLSGRSFFGMTDRHVVWEALTIDKTVNVWSLHVAFFLTAWRSGWRFLTSCCGVARMTIPANMVETALPFMIYPWKSFNIIPTTFFLFMSESKICPNFTYWWKKYQSYNSEEFWGWEKLPQLSLENTICYSGHTHWPQ